MSAFVAAASLAAFFVVGAVLAGGRAAGAVNAIHQLGGLALLFLLLRLLPHFHGQLALECCALCGAGGLEVVGAAFGELWRCEMGLGPPPLQVGYSPSVLGYW